MTTLTVKKRDKHVEHANALRKLGTIPAIVYGPKQESIPLTTSLREFEKVFKEVGESSVVSLEGLGKPFAVLIHDIDYHPVTSVVRHVDFYAVEEGAKIVISVPLVFVGESPAIKAGASLVKVLHEVEVEAEATNLMRELSVDISTLVSIGDSIHVGDLSLTANVTLITDPNEVVVLVQEVEEEKPEVVETPDIDTIEVEKKGKQEDASAESSDQNKEA